MTEGTAVLCSPHRRAPSAALGHALIEVRTPCMSDNTGIIGLGLIGGCGGGLGGGLGAASPYWVVWGGVRGGERIGGEGRGWEVRGGEGR